MIDLPSLLSLALVAGMALDVDRPAALEFALYGGGQTAPIVEFSAIGTAVVEHASGDPRRLPKHARPEVVVPWTHRVGCASPAPRSRHAGRGRRT
jgi:hypothetical protein